MPVPHLPFELLAAIFEEVIDPQDLRNARLASRTLCAAATPIAFRFLSVIATRASAQNLGRLFDVPDIAAHVRVISYRDTGSYRKGRIQKYVRTSAIQELASLFSRIHQLTRLEAIKLVFYGRWHDFDSKGHFALQNSILRALKTSFSVRPPSNLTSLSMHSLNPSVISFLHSPGLQPVLTALQHLDLRVILEPAPGPNASLDHWMYFWDRCPHIALSPTQSYLAELTLHPGLNVGSTSGFSLRPLHFPHLRALSLCNIVFDRPVAAEDFILRHASTLVRLELLMCKLPTDNSLAPNQSTTDGARDAEPGDGAGYYWDGIWHRFAEGLKALVELHIDQRRRDLWGNAGSECRYVIPGPSVSYLEVVALGSRNAADAEALRRFRTIVSARSEETRRKS